MVELVLAEPFRLQLVIAVGEARIGLLHGGHQRIHHLALDPVRQVAGIRHILEPAPAVADLLVLGQHIGDEGEGALVGAQGRGDGLGGLLADGGLLVLHQVEGGLDGQLLVAHLEAQGGDGLVEEPVPGAPPGDGLLVEELLDPILQLIGLLAPHILDPGPVMGERGLVHGRLKQGVVDSVQLQGHENEVGGGVGDLFLGVAKKFCALGIGGVARVDQARIGHDTPDEILETLITGQHVEHRPRGAGPRGEVGQLAPVDLRKSFAIAEGPGQILRIFRGFHPRIEVGQIPFGQSALGGRGPLSGGGASGESLAGE